MSVTITITGKSIMARHCGGSKSQIDIPVGVYFSEFTREHGEKKEQFLAIVHSHNYAGYGMTKEEWRQKGATIKLPPILGIFKRILRPTKSSR